VSLEDWAAGEAVTVENMHGLEFLVLSGELSVGGLGPTACRNGPDRDGPTARARIWIKEALLMHPDVVQMPS
jgi:hypothetical protein